jgi:uncharacterized membrane protein
MIKKIFTIPNISLVLCFATWIFFTWAAVIAIGDPNPRLSPEELNKALAEKSMLVHIFMILCIVSLISSVVLAFMSLKKARRRAIISLAINSAFLFWFIYGIL